MNRILRLPDYGAPVDVPAPAAWNPSAQAAYERGLAEGREQGHRTGRLDAEPVTQAIAHAVTTCAAEIARVKDDLDRRVLQVAEMYVATVLRHVPDARTSGLLVRIAEAIDAIDAGAIVICVRTEAVTPIAAAIGALSGQQDVSVVADDTLQSGEFRLRTEWAEAEGTWDRYLAAAQTAVEMYVAEELS